MCGGMKYGSCWCCANYVVFSCRVQFVGDSVLWIFFCVSRDCFMGWPFCRGDKEQDHHAIPAALHLPALQVYCH